METTELLDNLSEQTKLAEEAGKANSDLTFRVNALAKNMETLAVHKEAKSWAKWNEMAEMVQEFIDANRFDRLLGDGYATILLGMAKAKMTDPEAVKPAVDAWQATDPNKPNVPNSVQADRVLPFEIHVVHRPTGFVAFQAGKQTRTAGTTNWGQLKNETHRHFQFAHGGETWNGSAIKSAFDAAFETLKSDPAAVLDVGDYRVEAHDFDRSARPAPVIENPAPPETPAV